MNRQSKDYSEKIRNTTGKIMVQKKTVLKDENCSKGAIFTGEKDNFPTLPS